MLDTYLGFDYSRRKIGVASGQSLTQSANALQTITNLSDGPNWAIIGDLIKQYRPSALIVGLPLNMDGSEQKTSEAAREFGEQLSTRFELEVFFMDERLSSREASHILGYDGHTSPKRQNKAGKKVKKQQRQGQDIDSMAAQLILQSWLNSQ